MTVNIATTTITTIIEPFITDPFVSYEVLNLDGNGVWWVGPHDLSEFTEETGIDLETLKRHAATGEPLMLEGHCGLWTVAESH